MKKEINTKALVVGGNSGIGLAVTLVLLANGYSKIYILGKDEPNLKDIPIDCLKDFNERTIFFRINLLTENYEVFEVIQDINTLIISVGFGRVAPFEELTEIEITNLVKCNELVIINILKKYYSNISSSEPFYCAVMGSFAGHVSSPLFSVYGAAKAGLCRFIENINLELIAQKKLNRILDVSPGFLEGTRFDGGQNDMSKLSVTAIEIINRMFMKEILYIPQFDEIYKEIIEHYRKDPVQFGISSYKYKIESGRLNHTPQVTIGYLSGTFDLFHIGHLNLLKRAKDHCDYLIVGVHESGAWKGKETFISFNERKAIVQSVRYVDKVVDSFLEDSDAYNAYHIDKLFVGDDYKGSERFSKYEKYFKNKNVQIIYFPYTKGVSSTQLRDHIFRKK